MSLGYNTKQRSSINRVQIALRVFVILDLLVSDRSIIKLYYREGLRDNSSVSTLQWPNLVPSKSDITTWK